MQIDYQIPFYSNTSDNLHCFEASLRMILKYFKPKKEYSWKEMDNITGKKPNLWTWPQLGLLWFQKHGFEVINMEIFNYPRFVQKGESYLMEFYGKEAGIQQINHSDIPHEQKISKQLIEEMKIDCRIPSVNDIRQFLEKGYLLNCLVNSKTLSGKSGYVGHSIVIKGITESEVIFHDPGLPAQPNRKIGFGTFEKAWAFPNEKAKNLVAIKIKN